MADFFALVASIIQWLQLCEQHVFLFIFNFMLALAFHS